MSSNAEDYNLFTSDYLICTPVSTECECQTDYQFYDVEEKILLGIVCVFVISFGIVANLMSVRIFTNKVMSSACINWYLAVLSASDTAILFSSFFVLTLPRLGEFFWLWKATSFSYFTTPYFYGLMTMAQTISVWMTVALSLHRFIGVYYPYKAIELLNESNIRKFILALLTFSILFNMSRFFEVDVVNNCYRSNINAMMPVIAPTDLRQNSAYRLIFFGWAYTIIMFLVPFATLITVNSAVLIAIRRSNRLHSQRVIQVPVENLQSADSNVDKVAVVAKKASDSKERQTTAVLIALVIVFLCCNTLAFLANIMENLGFDSSPAYNSIVLLNNVLVIVNASSNVFIYMLFSEKYRRLLHLYLYSIYKGRKDENELLLTISGPVSV